MISLTSLFILLLTAETIHAQGNKNDGDGVDQASGYNQDTSLPLEATSTTLPTILQASNTPDQSSTSPSTDRQPEEECKSGHGIQQISKSCPQQQSPPEPQSSTSYDHPQSNEMPLPAYAGESEVESYREIWETDQYRAFTKKEVRYFESEYSCKKKLGEGGFGMVYLAIRKSDGMEVAYKSIINFKVRKYATEFSPPPRCHLRNPLVLSEEQSVAQCMSSRPPNLLVPYEIMLQTYLSRPGYENPYVPVVFDYFIFESECILVMEHLDEKWVNLSKYMEEKGRLDILHARRIIKEIVNGMIYLKQYGIMHGDLHEENVMYNLETRKVKIIDFGMSDILPEWEAGKSSPSKSPDPSSANSEYKTGADEPWRMKRLGTVLYRLITPKGADLNYFGNEQAVEGFWVVLLLPCPPIHNPTSILRVMQGHYGSLAADTTGHSLDLQYWHDRQPIQVSPNTPPIRNSDILDQDFSWNQIAAALLQMSPRKAPGDDGITTAFYQAALYMPANTQEGVPPTPFARALLRVCGQVFALATIPHAWLCASIVSIDKKDGDPLNPGDKRGIALINVGLKLVCKVLQIRIERFVETNNLLSYEQAGFRKREGCVGQVGLLVDIIQRRQNAGLNTHVLFIDIRKAFDTVPVGALLWKLQNMGFPRRTLAFLKALYTSPSARSRAGSLLSDPFPVQRGVRHGCPLSGLLFNLFINDILDGVAPITVPGLSRDTNPIRGLMYADDVAVFADSEQSLLAASTAIEQWANQWEMQFGVAKCGIISFTGHLAPRLDNPLDIRLHGQLVSRVESYKYLGVLIDSKLDHSAWLKQKRFALENTISALHPVLANHQLTVNYRSCIFSAVVVGKAYYGLELVGGNKSHLAPLQTTINKGIRLFTGARLSTAHWCPSG
ncbi:hypothetical protein BASA83_003424 [Batrachochytrium salamandrivorans]|nr:hypothetical protein BASA83_003424 [Batrachochytrium salamandrivorans]